MSAKKGSTWGKEGEGEEDRVYILCLSQSGGRVREEKLSVLLAVPISGSNYQTRESREEEGTLWGQECIHFVTAATGVGGGEGVFWGMGYASQSGGRPSHASRLNTSVGVHEKTLSETSACCKCGAMLMRMEGKHSVVMLSCVYVNTLRLFQWMMGS